MNLRKIIISIILGVGILAAGIAISNRMVASKEQQQRQPPPAAVREVKTILVENRDRIPQTDFLGQVLALDRAELFAEVSGRLLSGSKRFQEGVRYGKGEVIFRMDDEEARLSLVSQKSAFLSTLTSSLPDIRLDFPERYETWKDYAANVDVSAPLSPLPDPASDREKFFLSNRNILNQFYTIESQQARLAKYRIRAPFQGVVSESNITEGTLVRVGQKLGTLASENVFEVSGTVPRDVAKMVEAGDDITFTSDDGESWSATVSRVSSYVDPSTQSVRIFARIKGDGLQEGVYLKGSISSSALKDVMEISNNWLQNESVLFLVKDSLLKKVDVEVAHTGEQQSLVKGLPEGAILMAEELSGAYDGMQVKIRRP